MVGEDDVGATDGSAVVGLYVGDCDGKGVGRIETDGKFEGCVDGSSDTSLFRILSMKKSVVRQIQKVKSTKDMHSLTCII